MLLQAFLIREATPIVAYGALPFTKMPVDFVSFPISSASIGASGMRAICVRAHVRFEISENMAPGRSLASEHALGLLTLHTSKHYIRTSYEGVYHIMYTKMGCSDRILWEGVEQ